jgi:UDP-N-acetylmuramate--alanine ligase
MSNLARYFKNLGKKVSGYDKTPSVHNELIESGISIHFEDDINAILKIFT